MTIRRFEIKLFNVREARLLNRFASHSISRTTSHPPRKKLSAQRTSGLRNLKENPRTIFKKANQWGVEWDIFTNNKLDSDNELDKKLGKRGWNCQLYEYLYFYCCFCRGCIYFGVDCRLLRARSAWRFEAVHLFFDSSKINEQFCLGFSYLMVTNRLNLWGIELLNGHSNFGSRIFSSFWTILKCWMFSLSRIRDSRIRLELPTGVRLLTQLLALFSREFLIFNIYLNIDT